MVIVRILAIAALMFMFSCSQESVNSVNAELPVQQAGESVGQQVAESLSEPTFQTTWTVKFCSAWSDVYGQNASYHFTVDNSNPPSTSQQNAMKTNFSSTVSRWGSFVNRTLSETASNGLEVRLSASGSSGLSPSTCAPISYLKVSYGSHSLAILFHELAHTYGLDHQTSQSSLCNSGGTYDSRSVAERSDVLTPSVGDFNALASCFDFSPIGPNFSATATVPPNQWDCNTKQVNGRFMVNGYDVSSPQVNGVKWQYLQGGNWYDYAGSFGYYNFTVSTSSPGDGLSPYYVRFYATYHTGTIYYSSQVKIVSTCQQ